MFLLSVSLDYMGSVKRGFLFLLVLSVGVQHSMVLPYDKIEIKYSAPGDKIHQYMISFRLNFVTDVKFDVENI